MLSLLLLFSCADQPIVSCEDACAWTFTLCGSVNGATFSHRLDECLDECTAYPDDGDAYADCMSPYVSALPLSTETCNEPFTRPEDGSDIPCPSFTPCDPDEGCAP